MTSPTTSAPSVFWPSALRRLLDAVGGACLFAVIGAAWEALWVRGASEGLGFCSLWAACLGLAAPFGLGCGVGVGFFALVLHPQGPPGLRGLLAFLSAGDRRQQSRTSATLALFGMAGLLWLLASARFALGFFESGAPAAVSGVGLALGIVALGAVLNGLALGLADGLARWWERAFPAPALVAGGLPVLWVGVLAYGVSSGTVAGEGGLLGIFGVLKRPELDLRAVGLLGLTAGAAYFLPSLIQRVPGVILILTVLGTLSVTPWTATRGLADRTLALAVLRNAPLSRLALSPLRKLTDRDHDGASPLFGGGDCNDHDPHVGPAADDEPGNGIDEDCSGVDAQVVVLAPPQGAAPAPGPSTNVAAIPADLNVVVLMIDAWRWDTAGFMGYPRPVTPHLDALAKKSVVFERSYSMSSYTGKSIPPMMIGKYGLETHRGWAHFNRIDPADTLLWERLRPAGIRTLSAQGYWYFFSKGVGFERGWDVLDTEACPSAGYVEKDTSVVGERMADRTMAVLGRPETAKSRFFFWNHWVDPHADYVKHEGIDFGPTQRDRYDAEVAYTDRELGRVLDFIERSEFGKRTAIIVTADHGEAFGEHGMIRHGFEVWEPLVRVPLIVYVPGAQPHRVSQPRSAVDLVPTVLELFHLPRPTGEGSDFVSGVSWVPDVFLAPGKVPEARMVLVDMQAGPNNTERQAFLEGDLKLIASGGSPLGLYDLAKDPEEKQDLLDQAELRERMVSRYRAFRKGLREVVVKPTSR